MENNREHFDLTGIDDRSNVFSSLNWDSNRIKEAKVMVIGAGALGNEVLKNLALIGVENILISDFDVIERSNLAKSVLFREQDCTGTHLKVDIAAQRLKEINPSIKTMTINGDATLDIGLGVFNRVDIVIGCVDNRLTRLWINRFCHWLNKPWIDGGIMDLGGQITVFQPGKSCYECNITPQAWKNIEYRNSCITRAKRYASSGIATTTPITSSIIAAMQVQEALKFIVDPNPRNSLAGEQFYYEGMANEYTKLPYNLIRDTCRSHTKITEINKAKELSFNSTIGEALGVLQKMFDDSAVSIATHFEIFLTIMTENGSEKIPFIKPRPKVRQEDFDQFKTTEDEEVKAKDYTSEIDQSFPRPDLKLKDIGIPALHILKVISKGIVKHVELTGDDSFFHFK